MSSGRAATREYRPDRRQSRRHGFHRAPVREKEATDKSGASRFAIRPEQEHSFDVSDRSARPRAQAAQFQVRGRFLTALALRIDGSALDDALLAQLDDQLGRTPQFFSGAPVVLNLDPAPADPARLRALVARLRGQGLRVFGLENAGAMDPALLEGLGLIPVAPGRDAPMPRPAAAPEARQDPPAADAAPRNKVIRVPVRSGQVIMAEQGDLTVIGSVASGAELIAAGNIHVYGPLRGRAIAGCHGDESAHIFCQSLNAELVAIAGLYQTSETLEEAVRQQRTHIYLEDEKLRMEVIA